MKLIKPSYSIIEPTGYTIDDIYKSIELAGKVSHKSEHNIKEGSAKEFVDRMIKLGHGATLEFGTVYLYTDYKHTNYCKLIERYTHNKYSKCNHIPNRAYISSNLRVLVENNWLDDLKYLCEPTEHHEKRICVKFICDRGILSEFTRHRKFSFMAESTRYCNYSKDRFNNELTFILPCWWKDEEGNNGEAEFCNSLQYAEEQYLFLLDQGWKPEQARAVLPLALKTELYMCGFISDWINFFKLRDDKQHAHPQAYELVHPLHEEFIKREYI